MNNNLQVNGEDLKKLIKLISILVLALSLFIAVLILNASKSFQHIGKDIPIQATVSFSGEGEVFAVPDVAEISFSITNESMLVEEAQTETTEKMNSILVELKNFGIEEKDIKTLSYNVYPRYEYVDSRNASLPVGGQRVLRGYEVSHTVSVKIRNMDESGVVLSRMGELGVSNISGIHFTVEDEDDLKREARRLAINDAKSKARELAKDLGVRLGRVVSFYDNQGGLYPYGKGGGFDMMFAEDGAVSSAPVPDLPVGEDKIISSVTITYELK